MQVSVSRGSPDHKDHVDWGGSFSANWQATSRRKTRGFRLWCSKLESSRTALNLDDATGELGKLYGVSDEVEEEMGSEA